MTSFLSSIGKRKKTPDQLVASSIKALTTVLDVTAKAETKATAMENLNKYLLGIKNILYGTSDVAEVDEEKTLEASKYIQQEKLIVLLINNLDSISFEARKDTALIFNNLTRKNINNFVDYLKEHMTIIDKLIQGYVSTESALNCGAMLRETIRYDNLSRYILYSDLLWEFFDIYVHLPNFEIASDAFGTLKDLLTTPKHPHIAEEFMSRNSEKLLEKYDVSIMFYCFILIFCGFVCVSVYVCIYIYMYTTVQYL